jgi:hypothetical protein
LSQRLKGALLNRLTHHVHILELNGESYRRDIRSSGDVRGFADGADTVSVCGSISPVSRLVARGGFVRWARPAFPARSAFQPVYAPKIRKPLSYSIERHFKTEQSSLLTLGSLTHWPGLLA